MRRYCPSSSAEAGRYPAETAKWDEQDDQWIIGKREWEIVERYGEFDYETKPGVRMGYYIGEENNVFETHGKKLYYFILFDNDYKAKKVVIGGRPGKD